LAQPTSSGLLLLTLADNTSTYYCCGMTIPQRCSRPWCETAHPCC
jgi:hypothetical protein